MPCTKIIFERVTSTHFPIIKYYLQKQREISFFDNDNLAKKKGWVKKLVREGKISPIPPIGYVYNECYGTALDNVEKVYKYFLASSSLAREMIRIYGDGNIELAYKKELVRGLS